MRATEILFEEHRRIRSLLDCLSKLILISNQGGGFDVGAAEELFDLFEAFADGSHQEKEETCLFPRLRMRASGKEASVLEKLVNEHAEDRVGLAGLRSKLQVALLGDVAMKREFLSDADTYVAMQRNHMKAENTVAFPMAERILSAQDDRALIEEFDRLDGTSPGAVKHLDERVVTLCQRLGVPVVPGRPGQAAGGAG